MVKLGEYVLSDHQKFELSYGKEENIPMTREMKEQIKKVFLRGTKGDKYENMQIFGDYLLIRKEKATPGNEYSIGDIKISFQKVPCGPTTIIAQQAQDEHGFLLR